MQEKRIWDTWEKCRSLVGRGELWQKAGEVVNYEVDAAGAWAVESKDLDALHWNELETGANSEGL